MVLRRAGKLITPLKHRYGFLTSKELYSLDEGNLPFLGSNGIASILSRVNHPMEPSERFLKVGDEALRVASDFVLQLEDFLGE